jgi:peptidoglycan/LPS O-acetylase OafA/YrhL
VTNDDVHYPRLDGIRGVALLLVFWAHFAMSYDTPRIEPGHMALKTFFCLSGFLITGILLKARAALDAGEVTLGHALRQFYVRRVLRIFPVYYAMLLMVAWGDFFGQRAEMGWHVLYLTNWRIVFTQEWHFPLSHIWSLAVEEQFYLTWPWVVMLAPRRVVRWSCLVAIAAAVAWRIMIAATGRSEMWLWGTPGPLDSIAVGALLAVDWRRPTEALPSWLRLLAPLGVAILLLQLLAGGQAWFDVPNAMAGDVLRAVAYAALIAASIQGRGGVWGRLLQSPVVAGLGRISYGAYVWHVLVYVVTSPPFLRMGWPDAWHGDWRTYLVYSALSILAGWVSWRVLEGPLNALKRFVPAARQRPLAQPSAAG